MGFETPVPDFTDCSFVTVEPDEDWLAVAHDGGPARAFDRRMPAFGDALSTAELQETLDYIRGFCADRAWPRGELNLPRALVTEKAFPENEFVLTTTVAASGSGLFGNEFLYEKRFGPRARSRWRCPFWRRTSAAGSAGWATSPWRSSMRPTTTPRRGHILSLVGEVVLPTGKESVGLGKGVTIFEPFVTFGQILPAGAFVQAQAGFELPADTDRAAREAFWRAAVGKTYTQGRFGRAWSPMVELLAARELERRGVDALGCRAPDADHAQSTAASHDQRRRANPDQSAGGPEHAGHCLLPVGLVRWGPDRWLVDRMRRSVTPFGVAATACLLGLVLVVIAGDARALPRLKSTPAPKTIPARHADMPFPTSHECLACHNGLSASTGEDVSIGATWRASMMANSARDPYWHAAVRRETIDHPSAAGRDREQVRDVPHADGTNDGRGRGRDRGRSSRTCRWGPARRPTTGSLPTASPARSATRSRPDGLGTPASFTGGFALGQPGPRAGERRDVRAASRSTAGRRR